MSQKQNIKILELIDKDTGKKEPYVLELNQLGKGFYGTVFKAVHKYNPNMIFAVKVIKTQTQQSKDEILKELQIIQKIPKSPNLVDTHKQHLESGRNFYIFQQYCDGGSLAEFRQKNYGRLMKESSIYDMFYQLGRGYIDLYKAGIIHEDIKPSNILIKGRIYKYCDFGVSELASNVKHSNSRRGTISYMPPQKLKQKFIPNPKSDIYSLGVTLYEVIFGFHPYLDKKTKNMKEYLTFLNNANLRPIHQLTKKVYNPSIIFNQFVNILEGMISLKVETRVGIQQLTEILMNQQPFKYMKIPQQNELPPKLKKNPYEVSQNFNIIAQSKIIFRECQKQLQNRLVNHDFSISLEQSSEQCNTRQEQYRMSKIKQQEENRVILNLKAEYMIIQAVISHFTNGANYFSKTFSDIQQNSKCKGVFFAAGQLKNVEQIVQQNLSQVLKYFILKFNLSLMNSFTDSVQNFQKFYQKVQLSKQAQYLEAQISKFISQKNMKDQAIKILDSILRNWTPTDYCKTLTKQFDLILQCVVYQNSIRINFKNDLLNGIFLLHANKVLNEVQKLPGIGQTQSSQSFSSIIQSQQIQRLDRITKNFNVYKTLKVQDLKNEFYKEFQAVNDIIYDFQDNSGEFINLTDLISEHEYQASNQSEQIIFQKDLQNL